jgi:alcohol dehydrogenase class IV
MSHALGGLKSPRLHHGTLNAVILPAVLRFNESHAEEKYRVLRAALGLPEDADLAEAIAELSADLGLPKNLSEMGVPRDCLPLMAERAMADHSTATNPRPLTVDDYRRLFDEAME